MSFHYDDFPALEPADHRQNLLTSWTKTQPSSFELGCQVLYFYLGKLTNTLNLPDSFLPKLFLRIFSQQIICPQIFLRFYFQEPSQDAVILEEQKALETLQYNQWK